MDGQPIEIRFPTRICPTCGASPYTSDVTWVFEGGQLVPHYGFCSGIPFGAYVSVRPPFGGIR